MVKSSRWADAFTHLINMLLDGLSAVDLVSDFIVIWSYINSKHGWWMCNSLIMIIFPFYVAQVPFLNYKLD